MTVSRPYTGTVHQFVGTFMSEKLPNTSLENSGYGNFGVAITNPVSEYLKHFLCKVTAMHAHFFFVAAAVQEVEEIIDLIKHRTQFFTR